MPPHPHITEENFQPGKLAPLSYDREELAEVIIKHINREGDDMTTRQQEALSRYKYTGTWNIANPSNTEDLRKWFGCYNDVFFNGILTGYVPVLEFFKNKWAARGESTTQYLHTALPNTWVKSSTLGIGRIGPAACIPCRRHKQDSKGQRREDPAVHLGSGTRARARSIALVRLQM